MWFNFSKRGKRKWEKLKDVKDKYMCPTKFIYWGPNPKVAIFGDKASKEVTEFKLLRGRLWSRRKTVLIKTKQNTPKSLLSPSPLAHPQRRGHMSTQCNGGHPQAKTRGLRMLDSSLQNCERIHFYCLSRAVCGVLLRQLEQTKKRRINGHCYNFGSLYLAKE